jgi:hydrogenase/urease accessory protein HupE
MSLTSNKYFKRLATLTGVVGLLFATTNPSRVPAFIVAVAFVLLSLTIYYMIYGLIGLLGLYGLNVRRKRPLALYMTLIIGLLLALQSVDELGARDIFVMLPLALLGYFYSSYAKNDQRDVRS